MSHGSYDSSRFSLAGLWSLLACFALVTILESPAGAAIIYVEGSCTLIQAIKTANFDVSNGGCVTGSGHDTIVLSEDVELATDFLSTFVGLPRITSEITIEGHGFAVERAGGAPDFRIFWVRAEGDLTLRQVLVRNGRITINATHNAHGGCIFNNGTLELVDSAVSGCLLVGETSWASGGGIMNQGVLVVTNSTISSNGVFSDTYSTRGGGIMSPAGTLTVTNSTISGNYALSSDDEGYGGGLYSLNADTALIRNVTFSGNSADDGAALYAGSGTTIQGSILADSLFSENCSGAPSLIVDDGGNEADDDSCDTIPDTLTGLDPVLRDNGGPTRTHALLDGSSAILGAGVCNLLKDQRGAPRGYVCDSGAFEHGGCPQIVLSDETVLAPEVYETCQIRAGTNVYVYGPFGDLTLRAGREIELTDGFSVGLDAGLTLEMDPDLIP